MEEMAASRSRSRVADNLAASAAFASAAAGFSTVFSAVLGGIFVFVCFGTLVNNDAPSYRVPAGQSNTAYYQISPFGLRWPPHGTPDHHRLPSRVMTVELNAASWVWE